MRWLHFSVGGRTAYGIIEGDTVKEVAGNPILGEWSPTSHTHRLADITYEVPIIPRTFYAAGLNYAVKLQARRLQYLWIVGRHLPHRLMRLAGAGR